MNPVKSRVNLDNKRLIFYTVHKLINLERVPEDM